MLNVKVKRLSPQAKLPTYGTEGAAAFDISALEDGQITAAEGSTLIVKTGLSFEIPKGHVMLIVGRSGHGFKENLRLANCVGVIDSDYRGELMVKLTKDDVRDFVIKAGDRIAQAMIMPLPHIQFEEVEELSNTARGTGGLGSTG